MKSNFYKVGVYTDIVYTGNTIVETNKKSLFTLSGLVIITTELVAKNYSEHWSESSRKLKNNYFWNKWPRDFFGAVSL